MKKKGAIELSINTIIIIVIGVTLLTLGLVFVKNVFTQLGDLSDKVFDTADTEIGQIHRATKFTSPTSVEVKQGQKKTFKIYVGHDGKTCGAGPKKFSVKLVKAQGSQFSEKLIKAMIISPPHITLEEGQEAGYVVQLAVSRDAPLSKGSFTEPAYSVEVLCQGKHYDGGAFTINIVTGGGLFG